MVKNETGGDSTSARSSQATSIDDPIEFARRARANLLHFDDPRSQLLDGLRGAAAQHARGARLAADRPVHLRVLTAGWACRLRNLPDGRRQIFGFVLPGDLIGLSIDEQQPRFCEVITLTRAATVDYGPLRSLLADPANAALGDAIREANHRSERRLLDHLVRLGVHNAYEATAHLFLELHERLNNAGLVRDGWFPMPIGQRTLAIALGLSPVHLNRVIKDLRVHGHLEQGAGRARLADPIWLQTSMSFNAFGTAERHGPIE